ncbi:AraC family transcriptional regulator [Rhodococcus phenolicus]|uniref:AraC family transcriptional regulator n=1 Tax=Rhodococcus phenolicus TaxID=263849 RepID=UPI0009EE33DE|nr:AraC family transcriptional regulator [Rhodococcus phenolicus]
MKPLARHAALNDYVDLAHSVGLDPARMVRDAGLDPAGLSLQDRWVPASAIAGLLENSAAASGREDFGIALAELRRFSNLGPLSLVVREEPDVRSAVKMLVHYEHMYNEALKTRISENAGITTLRVGLDVGVPGDFPQSIDLAVGVLYQLLLGFLGRTWRPVSVSFTRPAPRDPAPYRRMFRTDVFFGERFDGISLYSKDLDAPNVMSDPLLRPYTQKFLEGIDARRDVTTASRVRDLIELLLPTGRCSAEQVARSLGVDRRTVHRKLAAEGHTFSSVLESTRADLASHMVGNTRHSLTEVSELLGFSSPANFSRWFRNQFGHSPSRWRAAAGGLGPPEPAASSFGPAPESGIG